MLRADGVDKGTLLYVVVGHLGYPVSNLTFKLRYFTFDATTR